MKPVAVVPGFFGSGLRVLENPDFPTWNGHIIWPPSRHIFPELKDRVLADGLDATDFGDAVGLFMDGLCPRGGVNDAEGVRMEPDKQHVRNTFEKFPPTKLPSEFWALGYEEGKNLEYIAYDWRLPPSVLQQRYNTWETFAQTVLGLDKQGTGVVLLGMSLGNLAVLYFLHYAERHYGRSWLDSHVHAVVQLGSPNLGSHQAVRGIIDALYDLPVPVEAVLATQRRMARSVAGGLWMVPRGEVAEQPSYYLRRGGVLLIKGFEVNVPDNESKAAGSVFLEFHVDWGEANAARGESSYLDADLVEASDGSFGFEDPGNYLQFGGPEALPDDATLKVVIKKRAFSGCEMIKWVSQHIGARTAYSIDCDLAECFESGKDAEGFALASMPLEGDSGSVRFWAKFLDFDSICSEWLGTRDLHPKGRGEECSMEVSVEHKTCDDIGYESVGGLEMMKMERLSEHQQWLSTYYQQDPLFDYAGNNDCPPINRLLTCAAVEVPTPCAWAVRLNTIYFNDLLDNRFVLDESAVLPDADDDWSISKGIISYPGDTVITKNSLLAVEAWGDKLDLTVVKVEKRSPGSRHGTELKDKRCMQAFKDLLAPSGDTTDESDASDGAGCF